MKLYIAALAAASITQATPPARPVDCGVCVYTLTDAQLALKKAEAVRGNSSSAIAIWNYYEFDQNDPAKGRFWIQLAAEQGLCEAQIEFAKELWSVWKDAAQSRIWLAQARRKECVEKLAAWGPSVQSLEKSLQAAATGK